MTVSRALRRQPGVSEEVIRRIERLAQTMGYRPNPLVQALMTQVRSGRPSTTSQVIGLLVPQLDDPQWGQQEWIRRCIQGAELRAQETGFQIEVFKWQRQQVSDERMDQILKARGIRGVVIAPLAQPGFDLTLDWAHYAAAAIGATLRSPQLHRVRHHAFRSIQIAVAKLQAAGFKRIGLALSAQSAARADHLWQAGFVHALKMHEDPSRFRFIYQPEVFEYKGFLRWLRQTRPDGIVIPDHYCYTWLCDAGIRIPDELAVATVNRYRQPEEMAGIDQQFDAMGAATVDLVVDQYYHGEFGVPLRPKDVLMGGDWIDGRTVPSPAERSRKSKTSRARAAARSRT